MKRWMSLLLAAVLLLLFPVSAHADYDYASIPTPVMYVVDADNPSHVFYAREADKQAYPASTTKIMTAILALENGNLDDAFMVGQEIEGTTIKFSSYSSLMGLQVGEMVTLRDLVYGLMLVSGNDAGEAIAKHVGGNVDGFVNLMNQKAASLGMSNTHFTNPHGVQNDNHYTTARDLATLAAYALKNPDFCAIMQTQTYTVPANNVRQTELVLNNSNRLLRAVDGDPMTTVYPYAIGIKTGDTDSAGKCIVAAAEKDGARIICVLLGDSADLYGGDKVTANLMRFVNAGKIFEYLFENDYTQASASELGLTTAFTTPVSDADAAARPGGTLGVTADLTGLTFRALPDAITNLKGNPGQIQASVIYAGGEMPVAPVGAGDLVGTVEYRYNGRTLFSAPLHADAAVAASGAAGTEGTEPAATATDDPQNDGPQETPLISHKRLDAKTIWSWVLILLVLLLVALIVVFIVTERRRKKREAARRRRAAQRRRQQRY